VLERFRPIFVLAGTAVVGYLILRIGPAVIWNLFRDLSWRLVLILVFPACVAVVLDALAWRFTFLSPPRSFGRLVGVRLAGDAVNRITPTASVGGDLVKALLLRPGVPLWDAMASIVADKTTSVTAQVLLLVAGLLVALLVVPVSATVLTVMGVAAIVEALCVAGFVAVQLRSVVGRGGRLLARLRIPVSPERQAAFDGTDRALRRLYSEHGLGLLTSTVCHFAGAALGALELYLFVRFLDVPISVSSAFAIAALGTAVKFFSFMVPASLGALEGGNVAIFSAFGLGPAAGLTYTLGRRLREIVWVAAGLLASSLLSSRPIAPGERQ
jgi:glycosyltransferase 2 family protein